MNDELEFDLEPKRVKVRVGKAWYWLQEASGDAGTKFRSWATSRAKMDDGKIVGVVDLSDIEPKLVAMCLYEMKPDGSYRYVTKNNDPVHEKEEVVRSWPDRIQTALYDKVMELSPRLRDKDTPESIRKAEELLAKRKRMLENDGVKNLQSSTTDGSSTANGSDAISTTP